MNAQQKAEIIRKQHERVGGTLTTKQLASLLSISERAVLGYLLNQIAPDPAYTPLRKASVLPIELITDMYNAGIGVDAISRFYACSPARIYYHLRKLQTTKE